MEQSNYNLSQLIHYVFSRKMIFNEEFIWILIYRLTELLIVPHLMGRSLGGIHPPSIYFVSGMVQIKKYSGFGIDPFFLPRENVESPYADVFALGRSMSCLVSGNEQSYSESLIRLIDSMQSDTTNQRPTVRAILAHLNNTLSPQRLSQVLEIHSDYTSLYNTYTKELYSYQERMKNEKMVLDKKFRKLFDMEFEFMYHCEKK